MEYVVATSGRTGSNLLQRLLENNGLNNPHEWFHPDLFGFPQFVERGGSAEAFLDKMRAEKTVDGIFGIKMMSNHARQVVPHMAAEVAGPADAVRVLFPEAKFIYLWREDTDRQALSFFRAQRSGKWTKWASEKEQGIEHEYEPLDLAFIEDSLRYIERANAFWERCFDKFGIEPYRLSYERLTADRAGVVGEIGEFLGVRVSEEPELEVNIVRQADELTERYLEELRAHRQQVAAAGG